MDYQTHRLSLTAHRDRLTAALKTLGTLDPVIAGDWVSTPEEDISTEADENVTADRMEAATERDAELAALETEYRNVERALQKLDDGTYGSCEVCGETIEAERLTIEPAARTCITHRDEEVALDY